LWPLILFQLPTILRCLSIWVLKDLTILTNFQLLVMELKNVGFLLMTFPLTLPIH
ncbi:hypothetical protein HDV02_006626, partial [Globomyces sp. JEL0801]